MKNSILFSVFAFTVYMASSSVNGAVPDERGDVQDLYKELVAISASLRTENEQSYYTYDKFNEKNEVEFPELAYFGMGDCFNCH